MINEFSKLLETIKTVALSMEDLIFVEKELPYGRQIKFSQAEEKVTLSLYNGKKGIKVVWGGAGVRLQAKLEKAFSDKFPVYFKSLDLAMPTYDKVLLHNCAGFNGLWAGSDESGKGDFFGPLVVAAVMLDELTASMLQVDGVKDCKELTDKEIIRLAPVIKEKAVQYAVLPMKPEIYNYRYAQMKEQHNNLNHLLAAGHIAALSKVLDQDENCTMVLVDQFSKTSGIKQTLEDKYLYLTVYEQPKAEADIAVAAASILARASFLTVMEELGEQVGETLPKGGGAHSTAAAQRIKQEYGIEILDKLVKKHFANFKKIK